MIFSVRLSKRGKFVSGWLGCIGSIPIQGNDDTSQWEHNPVWLRNLEQTSRTHATPHAHGHNHIFHPTSCAFNKRMSRQA